MELGGATFSHASLLASEAELSLLRFLRLCQHLDLHSHGGVGAAGAQLHLEKHFTPSDSYIPSKKNPCHILIREKYSRDGLKLHSG